MADRRVAGRYELGAKVSSGGMGIIYRATDMAFGREVAVKVVRTDREGPAAVTRFVNEARIAGRLQQTGIPPVHDVGTLPDSRRFLAMKMIVGQTLTALFHSRSHAWQPPYSASRGWFDRPADPPAHKAASRGLDRSKKSYSAR